MTASGLRLSYVKGDNDDQESCHAEVNHPRGGEHSAWLHLPTRRRSARRSFPRIGRSFEHQPTEMVCLSMRRIVCGPDSFGYSPASGLLRGYTVELANSARQG